MKRSISSQYIDASHLADDSVIASLLAHAPGVAFHIAPETHGHAYATTGQDGDAPAVAVTVALATQPDRSLLYAALAHEVAHHLLGHVRHRPLRKELNRAARHSWVVLLPVAAAAALDWFLLAGGMLAALVVFHLVRRAHSRRQEMAADLLGVRLLDEAGLWGAWVAQDGLLQFEDTWWELRVAWLWAEHPTVRRRVRRIQRALVDSHAKWMYVGLCSERQQPGETMNAKLDLATATPADIDARFVELDRQSAMLQTQIAMQERIVVRSMGTTHAAEAGTLGALREKVWKLTQQIIEINAEYARRGGWSRVYVVPGGHAHRSRTCHTLYAQTETVLVPRDIRGNDMSGATDEQIVEAAGERACTHCYPDAPVEKRPSYLRLASEEEAETARAEREQAKAAHAAAKALKAITNPDGTTIRHDGWNITTESEARRLYVEAHADAEWNAYGIGAERHAEKKAAVEHLLIAIAAKHGKPVQEMRDELAKKATAKAKRDKRASIAHAKALGLPYSE